MNLSTNITTNTNICAKKKKLKPDSIISLFQLVNPKPIIIKTVMMMIILEIDMQNPRAGTKRLYV